MTRDVISCDIGEPMSRIYELMDLHQVRHAPITRNGELCGIISMPDVVKYRLGEIKAEAEAMKDYIAGRPAFAPRDWSPSRRLTGAAHLRPSVASRVVRIN